MIARTAEAIFSAIQFELADKSVLDLFAGCGQLGLEALSRGAKNAVFIDQSKEAIEIVKANAKQTGLFRQCRISCMDYSEFLKSVSGKEKFDIIFLDPPYSKDMGSEILKKVTRADIVNDGGIVVCETDNDTLCEDMYGLTLRKKYKYGKTYVTIFEKNEESVEEI